jgi:GDP-4-dehydro-6-deoxy-D-mannose reductase
MRILVTGANGFVGRHLLRELARHGHDILAFDASVAALPPGTQACAGDIRDRALLERLLREHAPDACVHLAGLTFVPAGLTAPEDMLAINVVGTATLLQTFRAAGSKARILVASTAQIYGTRARSAAVAEDEPAAPENLYAISKTAADQIALLYAHQCSMPVMTVRPHNHIGPGQSPQFVVPALACQLRAIAGGAEPVLRVGNLESRRDFTDVRDVAHAYRLLLESGKPGEAYNIACGRLVTIREVLDRLCALAGVQPRLQRDETLYRPADSSPPLDTRKIRADVGWVPEIELDTTLRDILSE